MSKQEERLLTESQAADELHISVAQLRTIAQQEGAPEHFTITVRTIRYLRSSVQEYATKGTQQ